MPAGGEFHEAGSGAVLGLATTVEAKNNRDVFDPGIGWRGGVGYGVTRRLELFGDFAWKRAEAAELSVGNVTEYVLPGANIDDWVFGVAAVGPGGHESTVSAYVMPPRDDFR